MAVTAEPPRWLDEEQRATWIAFLRCSRLVADAVDRQLRADRGIPLSWYSVLSRLSGQPDRTVRQGDLAILADFSPSRLSHAVGQLAARGWVDRVPHPEDGRVTDVRLTDAGAAAVAEMAPGHARTVLELVFDPLGADEVRGLRAACTALLRSMGADG